MEGGWGRENREEDKGTKERKRNGKEEGCTCEMGIKNRKGRGGGAGKGLRTKEMQGGGKRAVKGRRAKGIKGIGNKKTVQN